MSRFNDLNMYNGKSQKFCIIPLVVKRVTSSSLLQYKQFWCLILLKELLLKWWILSHVDDCSSVCNGVCKIMLLWRLFRNAVKLDILLSSRFGLIFLLSIK